MYVYKRTEFSPYCLYTVGYYEPNGEWVPESDHDTSEQAAERTAWLNGSRPTMPESVQEALNSGDGTYRP
jgi:hypothetical protein